MSAARHPNSDLDNLIYEITADAHDEDEQLMGFEAAFDQDASFPCPGTVLGDESKYCTSAEPTTATS